MKKYKVGIVTPTFPPKEGGIATAHFNIYQLLKEEYNVKVFAYNDIKEANEDRIIKRKTPSWIIPFINLFAKIYLKRYVQKVNYINVVRILHYSIGAWLLNKPIKRFNPDILIIPDNNIPLYWIKKRKYKIAWFTRNNYLRFRNNPLITNYVPIDIDIACSMERRAIKKADIVLSPSQYMIEEYSKAFNQNHPIYVINNFLFEKEVNNILSESNQITSSNKLAVFLPSAGTINKGSRYTFEIIRRISKKLNNTVDFYITGPIVQDLKFELQYLNSQIQVFTPGHISWKENLKVLSKSTIVVSPTLIENFSNAFVEAFVLGKPIVTFDVGGNKEIVDNDINGFIVPYIDIDTLIEKACLLLEDESIRKNFSNNAIQKANKFCNSQNILKQFENIFNELINNE